MPGRCSTVTTTSTAAASKSERASRKAAPSGASRKRQALAEGGALGEGPAAEDGAAGEVGEDARLQNGNPAGEDVEMDAAAPYDTSTGVGGSETHKASSGEDADSDANGKSVFELMHEPPISPSAPPVVQRVSPATAKGVGTLRVLSQRDVAARLSMKPTAGGVRISVAVQPELWPGRLLGEWTPQEHQQLTLALVTYGRDWQRARAMHVPSRSVDEIRLYAEKHLRHVRQPPPLVPPPSRPIFPIPPSYFQNHYHMPGHRSHASRPPLPAAPSQGAPLPSSAAASVEGLGLGPGQGLGQGLGLGQGMGQGLGQAGLPMPSASWPPSQVPAGPAGFAAAWPKLSPQQRLSLLQKLGSVPFAATASLPNDLSSLPPNIPRAIAAPAGYVDPSGTAEGGGSAAPPTAPSNPPPNPPPNSSPSPALAAMMAQGKLPSIAAALAQGKLPTFAAALAQGKLPAPLVAALGEHGMATMMEGLRQSYGTGLPPPPPLTPALGEGLHGGEQPGHAAAQGEQEPLGLLSSAAAAAPAAATAQDASNLLALAAGETPGQPQASAPECAPSEAFGGGGEQAGGEQAGGEQAGGEADRAVGLGASSPSGIAYRGFASQGHDSPLPAELDEDELPMTSPAQEGIAAAAAAALEGVTAAAALANVATRSPASRSPSHLRNGSAPAASGSASGRAPRPFVLRIPVPQEVQKAKAMARLLSQALPPDPPPHVEQPEVVEVDEAEAGHADGLGRRPEPPPPPLLPSYGGRPSGLQGMLPQGLHTSSGLLASAGLLPPGFLQASGLRPPSFSSSHSRDEYAALLAAVGGGGLSSSLSSRERLSLSALGGLGGGLSSLGGHPSLSGLSLGGGLGSGLGGGLGGGAPYDMRPPPASHPPPAHPPPHQLQPHPAQPWAQHEQLPGPEPPTSKRLNPTEKRPASWKAPQVLVDGPPPSSSHPPKRPGIDGPPPKRRKGGRGSFPHPSTLRSPAFWAPRGAHAFPGPEAPTAWAGEDAAASAPLSVAGLGVAAPPASAYHPSAHTGARSRPQPVLRPLSASGTMLEVSGARSGSGRGLKPLSISCRAYDPRREADVGAGMLSVKAELVELVRTTQPAAAPAQAPAPAPVLPGPGWPPGMAMGSGMRSEAEDRAVLRRQAQAW